LNNVGQCEHQEQDPDTDTNNTEQIQPLSLAASSERLSYQLPTYSRVNNIQMKQSRKLKKREIEIWENK
jgi:hypothetical protein